MGSGPMRGEGEPDGTPGARPHAPAGHGLSAFEREVLHALYRAHRAYIAGDVGPTSTVWSRAQYLVAKAHDGLRPSPVPNKHGLERVLEARLHGAVDALIRQGLAMRRRLGGYGRQHRQQLGYRNHAQQGSDIWLTAEGGGLAERLWPGHDAACLRGADPFAAQCGAPAPLLVPPDATFTWPCPPPDADGCLAWPRTPKEGCR